MKGLAEEESARAELVSTRDGMEIRFEVGSGEGRAVWRAESAELVSLGEAARTVWSAEAVPDDPVGSGKVVVPFCMTEPRYRMKVEVSRVSGFEASELWRAGVEVPGQGETREGDAAGVEVDGTRVRIRSLTAPGATVGGELGEFWNRWSGDGRTYTLWVELAPGQASRRLTLVDAKDDQGRSVEAEAGMWYGERFAFGLRPPNGAKGIRFTFAVHRSRVIELVVDTDAWTGN